MKKKTAKKKAARVKRTLEQRQALRIKELEERLETFKEHAIKDEISTGKVLKVKTRRIHELEKRLAALDQEYGRVKKLYDSEKEAFEGEREALHKKTSMLLDCKELLEATRVDCKNHLKNYELEQEKTAHLDAQCIKLQKQINDIVTRFTGNSECVMTFHRDQRAPELLLRDLHAMVKLAFASHQTVVLDVSKGSPDEHLTVKVCPIAFEGGEITKPGVQQ